MKNEFLEQFMKPAEDSLSEVTIITKGKKEAKEGCPAENAYEELKRGMEGMQGTLDEKIAELEKRLEYLKQKKAMESR